MLYKSTFVILVNVGVFRILPSKANFPFLLFKIIEKIMRNIKENSNCRDSSTMRPKGLIAPTLFFLKG